MMLSFLKWYRQSKDLRFVFSIKSNSLKININTSNRLSQFKFVSTVVNKEKIIRLEEINNIALTHKNVNSEKLTLLVNEITKHKASGRGLPEYIKLIDVLDILECKTPTQRSKYLTYLFRKEQIQLKSKEKKLKNKLERENRPIKVTDDNSHIQYGLGKNTFILRALRRSILKFYEKRLASAVLFGQKMVIDLGYDKLMTRREKKGCSCQIRLLYSCNRLSRDPYDLYFCNANPEDRSVQFLRHEIPNIDDTLVTLTEQSYLDLFPKENLVYLSPHASEALTTYDHKAVYIIGGFVDTGTHEDISSVKAKKEGIKSYRFPLEEFVAWGIGSKSLTINQVFSILQTMRDTGDWKEAFKHLPTRKLKRIDINSDIEIYSDKLYVTSSN